MNKKQLFEIVAARSGIDIKKIEDVFKMLNSVIIDALNKGEIVSIYDFGKFYIQDKPSVKRINPITKRFYFTKAKKVTQFKPFKKLKLCIK